jgi:sugar phosphate isomerase/epimerase
MRSCTRRAFLKHVSVTVAAPLFNGYVPGVSAFLSQTSAPNVHFSTEPRERISVSSYPFREYIAGQHDARQQSEKAASGTKMPLKDFAAHISARFNIHRVEPWSEHFLSLEPSYLDEIRDGARKAGSGFANVAADGENSLYSSDAAERDRAIEFAKTWIDVAQHIGSPSVRVNIAAARNAKPDVTRVADGLKPIADHAASRNIVVHLENDNPVSEDPFFIANVVERANSQWIHALPDFGNSLAALPPEDAYRGLDKMFPHAYAISHVKDTTTTPAKKVMEVDLERIFAMAKKHNYKGVFSMEWETAGDVYAGTSKLIAITLKNLS